MKILLTTLILAGWFSPYNKLYAQTKEETKKETKKENFYYTCSMHPEVKADRPGNCPICHMSLIKKNVETENSNLKLEVSQVEGRKSIRMDQATFAVSGAVPYKVTTKDVAFTIKTYGKIISPSRFTLQIAEVDLPYIRVGQSLLLKSPGMNNAEYHGKIHFIDQNLEPMGKTVRAEGSLFGENTLRPESTLIATIQIKKDAVISIPEDAILHSSTTDYVFVYDQKNSSLNPTKVTLGIGSDGEVEILRGLKPGMIITRGANFLLDSESRMQFGYDQKHH